MAWRGLSEWSWFAVVAAVAAAVQVVLRSGDSQEPGPPVMIGWALLAAGAALLARRPSPAWSPSVVLAGSIAVWLALYRAYDRQSGWPGTAGWETFAQSPVVLSWGTAGVLLALPTVAVISHLRRRPWRASATERAVSSRRPAPEAQRG